MSQIKYALQGKNPITDGTNFDINNPLRFEVSTEVQSVTVDDDGSASEILKTNVIIMPPEGYTQKWYMGHCMVAILRLARTKIKDALLHYKEVEGHNVIWLHTEESDESNPSSDIASLPAIISVCEEIGLPFTLNAGGSPGMTTKLFSKLLASPMGWHPTPGKPGMVGYGYNGGVNTYVLEECAALGYEPKDMWLMPSGWWPKSDGVGSFTGISYGGDGIYPTLGDGSGVAQNREAIRWKYNNWPLRGAISYFSNIGHNEAGRLESLAMGRLWGEGSQLLYASLGNPPFYDGLQTLVDSWFTAIAPPPRERSAFKVDMTTNDIREISYLSKLPYDGFEPGIEMFAAFDDIYNKQNDLRNDTPSHSGASACIRPIVDAYLNNKETYEITEDKAFFAHRLHPQNAPLRTEVPDLYKNSVYPDWFIPGSVYMTPGFGAAAQYAMAFPDFVEVVVHLTKGATVALYDENPAYYEAGIHVIRLNELRPFTTPFITVKRGCGCVKHSFSVQGIDMDVFPSFHNILVHEGTDLNKDTASQPKFQFANGSLSINGIGKIMVSQNKGNWAEYTGPIIVTENKPQGYWRAIIAATETSNPSPYSYSPQLTV